MASIEIPEDDIPKFLKLANSSEDEFSALIRSLEEIPKDLNVKETTEQVRKKAPDLVDVILGLNFTYIHYGISATGFAEILYDLYVKNSSKDNIQTNEVFVTKFKRLLNSQNAIYTTIKTSILRNDVGSKYLSCKFLTDIRPIFSQNDAEELLGSTITHTLKIIHQVNDGEQTTYISFDKEGLIELKKAIEKAERKQLLIEEEIKSLPALKELSK